MVNGSFNLNNLNNLNSYTNSIKKFNQNLDQFNRFKKSSQTPPPIIPPPPPPESPSELERRENPD